MPIFSAMGCENGLGLFSSLNSAAPRFFAPELIGGNVSMIPKYYLALWDDVEQNEEYLPVEASLCNADFYDFYA